MRSELLTGKRRDSDSEAEQDAVTSATVVSKIFRPRPEFPPIEKRKCPVSGCDSSGHLSGKLDTHFTSEACPRKSCNKDSSNILKEVPVKDLI